MSGTDRAYRAESHQVDASSRREVSHTLCCYARATRCPVLTYAMLLHSFYWMSGADITYAAARLLRGVRIRESGAGTPLSLHACYAMSGTDIAYRAICPCACYVMSSTGIP
eukprot:819818-Rhodomonas_salina.3